MMDVPNQGKKLVTKAMKNVYGVLEIFSFLI